VWEFETKTANSCEDEGMATALKTSSSIDDSTSGRMFGRIKICTLVFLLLVLVASAAFSWMTRDAMAHLQFLRGHAGNGSAATRKTLVDLSAWQTAQALAPLAVSAEEMEYAHDAERLADHEADQAFAVALRQAARQAQNRVLTGDALALSQKVEQLQQLVEQDQAQVASLTAKTKIPGKEGTKDSADQDGASQDDLETAKAQLGLDLDELADAKLDLERASGDNSSQIQGELAAHEALIRKFDSSGAGDGQMAVLSAKRNSTLALRVKAWFSQNSRNQLIQQALQKTQADIATLTAEHNALEQKAEAGEARQTGTAAVSHAASLASLKDKSAVRQILSIYDDRIQTEQQLATVYGKWSAQVQLQHRIVLHLILQSVMVIAVVGLGMLLGSALVRRLIARPGFDRREAQTLRSILELSVQVVGAGIILVVIFGSPEQVPTILGFATAAVTIALQDFIVAFLGWFVLVGKNGIHVGDSVEINGTTGEVTELGLFSTTLLETGDSMGKGQLTGRRVTFVNSYAIRGKYFNFSTSGQWTWDEITVSIPATANMHDLTERILAVVTTETQGNARLAEQDWKRGRKDLSEVPFSAEAVLSLRPSSTGIDVEARYVTRASERFEVRNRLNQKLIELLHQRTGETAAEAKLAVEGEDGAAH
jgi:small-conductance mechanosensitive channel